MKKIFLLLFLVGCIIFASCSWWKYRECSVESPNMPPTQDCWENWAEQERQKLQKEYKEMDKENGIWNEKIRQEEEQGKE